MKQKLLVLVLIPFFAHAQIITTIGGNHVPGYTGNGGLATAASMYQPNQLTVDRAGNIYIAESGNNVVRKISPSGIINVVAGTHTAGYSGDGGQATAAMLSAPLAVVVDTAGNIYISEDGNNVIRKVNTAGIISTIAGNGTAGFSGDGGPATAAELQGPFAMAFDATGNLFIADLYNNRIRKVSVSGIITTFAGTGTGSYTGDGGPASGATLNNPIDVKFDTFGNLYVCDFYNSAIRKINTSGTISTICGNGTPSYSGDGGPASGATLNYPYAICVDKHNNIYITDNADERIRKIDTSGIIGTVVGTGIAGYSGDGGLSVNAEIHNTGGIVTDTSDNLFIADFGNNVIRKVTNIGLVTRVNTIGTIVDNIFPNPTSSSLTITSPNIISSLAISNLFGETIYSQQYKSEHAQIDVANLPPGVYFIRINGSEVRRFIKQ